MLSFVLVIGAVVAACAGVVYDPLRSGHIERTSFVLVAFAAAMTVVVIQLEFLRFVPENLRSIVHMDAAALLLLAVVSQTAVIYAVLRRAAERRLQP